MIKNGFKYTFTFVEKKVNREFDYMLNKTTIQHKRKGYTVNVLRKNIKCLYETVIIIKMKK